jgi:hypothetical protein
MQTGMVRLAAPQGAINEKGRLLLCQRNLFHVISHRLSCPPDAKTLGDNDRNRTRLMTTALLIALLASLGLMAFIVKRLERA